MTSLTSSILTSPVDTWPLLLFLLIENQASHCIQRGAQSFTLSESSSLASIDHFFLLLPAPCLFSFLVTTLSLPISSMTPRVTTFLIGLIAPPSHSPFPLQPQPFLANTYMFMCVLFQMFLSKFDLSCEFHTCFWVCALDITSHLKLNLFKGEHPGSAPLASSSS